MLYVQYDNVKPVKAVVIYMLVLDSTVMSELIL